MSILEPTRSQRSTQSDTNEATSVENNTLARVKFSRPISITQNLLRNRLLLPFLPTSGSFTTPTCRSSSPDADFSTCCICLQFVQGAIAKPSRVLHGLMSTAKNSRLQLTLYFPSIGTAVHLQLAAVMVIHHNPNCVEAVEYAITLPSQKICSREFLSSPNKIRFTTLVHTYLQLQLT